MAQQVAEKACVVCGAKSHRQDWQTHSAPACDKHSKEEVAAASKPKAVPPAKKTPALVLKPLASKIQALAPEPELNTEDEGS